ncbi:TIGR04540 family protein [Clostridium botulinum]|nr:TIGR04540 family protein [Clostridium botulinum]NFR91042.1 TIGR04540 family protein [Clostridium botulinum]NFT99667.1 TIGR04540 family protein [Clostridium botulinum]
MEVRVFYKNQVEVAKAMNDLIDRYWKDEIKENILFEGITKIIINNENKIIRNGTYTTIIKQRCGKRRLEIIDRIFKSQDI